MSEIAATVDADNAVDAYDVADRAQAETTPEEGKSRFRALCEVSLAGIYIVRDGGIKYITDRKRAEAAVDDRLRFEKLLADLSAAFVNLPPERLDGKIDSSLKMLVEFLGNDRSTLVKFTNDKRHALPRCPPW
jgi:hypothetical protein